MLDDLDKALRMTPRREMSTNPLSFVEPLVAIATTEVGRYYVDILKRRLKGELDNRQWDEAIELPLKKSENNACKECVDGYTYKSNEKGYSFLGVCSCEHGRTKFHTLDFARS